MHPPAPAGRVRGRNEMAAQIGDGRTTINADELMLLSDHSRVVGWRAERHYQWEPIIGAAVVDQSWAAVDQS
jgi:hypothetical protein